MLSKMSDLDRALVERILRRAGAVFGFLHGSRVQGTARPSSDWDVAAYWGNDPPDAWQVDVPSGVDLVVLDSAPLELAGRVALHGQLLFEADPTTRVRWQAQTRLIYLDEEQRQRRLDAIYFAGRRRG
ncbi:MAG: nucleotidyltransferase domain-containing protein [Planctomycetota bacterium]